MIFRDKKIKFIINKLNFYKKLSNNLKLLYKINNQFAKS